MHVSRSRLTRPQPRSWSLTLRALAIAALLVGACSTTVLATGGQDLRQAGTPEATGGDGLVTAAAAPADTQAFVALNLDPDSAQFQDSARLSERAGFNDLVAALLDPGSSPAEADMALGLLESLDLTEVGVAVGPAPAEAIQAVEDAVATPAAGTPGAAVPGQVDPALATPFTLILASSDAAGAYSFLTGQLPALAGVDSGDVSEGEYAGAPVTTFTDSSGSGQELFVAQTGDLVLVALTEDEVDAAIDTAQGTADDITTTEGFGDVRGVLDGPTMLYSYSDTSAALDDPAYTQLLTDMGIDPALVGAYAGRAGLAVSADAAAPGFRVRTAFFPTGTDAATPAAIPDYSSDYTAAVPDSTMIYLGGNDLGAQLAPVISLAVASGAASAALAQMTEMTGQPATPPVELSEDQDFDGIAALVNSYVTLLAGEYVVAVGTPDLETLDDPNSLYLLFASEVSDGAPFEQILDPLGEVLFGGDPTADVTTEQVGGSTIYTVAPPADSAADVDVSFSYGVVDGQLVLGLGDSVRSFIEGPETALADDPQFQSTFDALGRQPSEGAVVYLDLSSLIPLVQTGVSLTAGGGDPAVAAGLVDADPACADYDDQADAQAAYDDDPFELADLDQDFDGEACEDFFAAATPAAGTPAADPFLTDLSAVLAYGQVTYAGDGYTASDGLVLLAAE